MGVEVRAAMLAQGYDVVGVDVRDAEVIADLASPAGRRAAVDAVLGRSAGSLAGLVLCAGIGNTEPDPARILAVNYFGAVEVLDGLHDALVQGAPAAVVAIASIASRRVTDDDLPIVEALVDGDEARAAKLVADHEGNPAYCISKLALSRAIRRRSVAWAPDGIRVNAIAPGQVDTPLLHKTLADPRYGAALGGTKIPLGRRATARDVADSVKFLMSADAAYVTGTILGLDGGLDAQLWPDAL
jgi:NAD(P)-dependent dehydrogenase (short-subunit alcohol dehydrogenase family)